MSPAPGVLSPVLDDNLARFRRLLHSDVNSDAHFRMLECAGTPLCALYIEGMADDRKISEFVLRACNEHRSAPGTIIDA